VRSSASIAPAATRRGISLALFAAATSAVGMVLSRDVMLTYPDPVGATLIRAVAALPGYFVLITAWRRWPAMLAALRNPPAMTTLTIGSIMGPLAGAVLVMIAFRHSTAGVVTTITATMPVLILPLSILVYRERIGLRAVGGAVLAVAGVALLML
jgi:drug/metabolite transporter (DMT)-like permease